MSTLLSPIERPRNVLLRLVYALARLRFGKVPTVLKVIYARQPHLATLAARIVCRQRRLSLEPELRLLVQALAAQLNGCAFCHDIVLAQALQRRLGMERFFALDGNIDAGPFTPRERAALALVDDATLRRRIAPATWKALREQFSEAEIVELVWLNAAENYFNLQAAVLGIGSDGLAAALEEKLQAA